PLPGGRELHARDLRLGRRRRRSHGVRGAPRARLPWRVITVSTSEEDARTPMSVLDQFRLDGKVAIVTGASSGLGVGFAEALAGAGADVVLGARRVDRLEEVKGKITAMGRRCIAVRTDVSQVEDCT